jgi:hypothetical protein
MEDRSWRTRAQPGADRAGTGTTPEYGIAGIEAQRRPARWKVSSGAGASTSACAALPFAAQQPVWARPVGASRSVVEGGVKSRASLRAPGAEQGAGDQP